MRSASSFPHPPGGGFLGTNVPYDFAQWNIPFIDLSSGTMGNNGALSAITALPTTFDAGAWCLFPAGAVAVGVPAAAAWLWVTFSSATAGTVWNSTYTSGVPRLGTQTAFATTGPGAFIGVTGAQTGPSIIIPGNSLGLHGQMFSSHKTTSNATAGAKVATILWGGLTLVSQSMSSAGSNWSSAETIVTNEGVTNRQSAGVWSQAGTSTGASDPAFGSVDTTANTTVSWGFNKATATDNQILLSGRIVIAFANS